MHGRRLVSFEVLVCCGCEGDGCVKHSSQRSLSLRSQWRVLSAAALARKRFCCAITTSPSVDAGSLDKRKVNEGEGLAPYRAGYRDSGSKVSKSMYSPFTIFCFTFSGKGGSWTVEELGDCAGGPSGASMSAGVVGCACGAGEGSEMFSAVALWLEISGRRVRSKRSSRPCMLASTNCCIVSSKRTGSGARLVVRVRAGVQLGERARETVREDAVSLLWAACACRRSR